MLASPSLWNRQACHQEPSRNHALAIHTQLYHVLPPYQFTRNCSYDCEYQLDRSPLPAPRTNSAPIQTKAVSRIAYELCSHCLLQVRSLCSALHAKDSPALRGGYSGLAPRSDAITPLGYLQRRQFLRATPLPALNTACISPVGRSPNSG